MPNPPIKTRGRPLQFPRQLLLQLTEEMGAAIDKWREEQPDNPSRNEAIRRLLADALKRSGRPSG